jgi:hypothetical protein
MVWKTCGTDSKIGKSYVQACTKHNKDFDKVDDVTGSNSVTVDNASDSRIEMMGGGFTEKEG